MSIEVKPKEFNIPVINQLGGISKNISSTFLKTDHVNHQNAVLSSHPESTIVIHPGSRYLKIGKAKAAFPQIIPHCIAYKTKAKEEGLFRMLEKGAQECTVSRDEFEDKLADLYRAGKRKRLPPNFYQHLRSFNEQQAKTVQFIPIDSDSFEADYSSPSDASFVTGRNALKLNPKSHFHLKWPMKNGRLNLKNNETHHSVMGDLDRIWTAAITNELGVNKKDIAKYSAVIVVDDHVCVEEIKSFVELAIQLIGFKGVAFLRTSQAATFGTGISSALVIDCGAGKTQVTCVEDGVLLPASTMVSSIGGDAFLQLFAELLKVNKFPVDLDIHGSPLDFELLENDIWLKQACLDDEELTATSASLPFEFFQRHPGEDTSVHSLKMLDERCMPLLEFFEDDAGMLTRFVSKDTPVSSEGSHGLTEALQSVGKTEMTNFGGLHSLVEQGLLCYSQEEQERVQKVLNSVLIIGGGLPSSSTPFILDKLKQKLGLEMELVQPGIDPRHVAWKGGAVLSKLDGVADCFIEGSMWRNKGIRLLADRLPFPL